MAAAPLIASASKQCGYRKTVLLFRRIIIIMLRKKTDDIKRGKRVINDGLFTPKENVKKPTNEFMTVFWEGERKKHYHYIFPCSSSTFLTSLARIQNRHKTFTEFFLCFNQPAREREREKEMKSMRSKEANFLYILSFLGMNTEHGGGEDRVMMQDFSVVTHLQLETLPCIFHNGSEWERERE